MFSIFWPLNLAKGLLGFVLNGLVFLSCLLTAMALMGDKGWVWSLTTHFRVQYLCVQALAFLFASVSYWQKSKPDGPRKIDQWVSLIVLGTFLGINLSAVLPYYLRQPRPDLSQTSGRPLKLMHINVFGNVNSNTEAVIKTIQTEQPDMIDFVEYTERWLQQLERSSTLKQYPYRLSGRGNMALYSKRPLINARLVYAGRQTVANQANIIAKIWLNGQPVTILVAHPASPIRPSHLTWLQESFGTWIKERPRLGKNLVVVGDLNTTPWSVEFKTLIEKTGLRDSQLDFGIQPSWPMLLPLIGIRAESNWLTQLMQIPIDHVLVSERLVVTDRHTGPFVGSDHLPVVVTLAVGPGQSPPQKTHGL
ncbi:endonuclease/exonuclease/phosphatase family protein [Vampirovibrio chlorellavorus]|uniref:endonuclease/exonuclease/phosphatase family protein n=1 Tax=Vampirovibrio chlorellavorus TaxID=758823 RepID=UPI0026F0E86F|nr:endonuclease/exonuclease/phosphatase family protein [Vampirovibrio chlorellavorus]